MSISTAERPRGDLARSRACNQSKRCLRCAPQCLPSYRIHSMLASKTSRCDFERWPSDSWPALRGSYAEVSTTASQRHDHKPPAVMNQSSILVHVSRQRSLNCGVICPEGLACCQTLAWRPLLNWFQALSTGCRCVTSQHAVCLFASYRRRRPPELGSSSIVT